VPHKSSSRWATTSCLGERRESERPAEFVPRPNPTHL
jgi:hypothetical protein